MKAIRESIIHSSPFSFLTGEYKLDHFDSPWHFHPEYELTFINEGFGTRFVGDSAESFTPNDFVLIGSDVPHYWRCDHAFYEDRGLIAHSVVIHFDQSLFFDNPKAELKSVHLMLKKSASGICFTNGTRYKERMFEILTLSGLKRLTFFYELMYELSLDQNYRLLSLTKESQLYQAKDSEQFQKVLNYIFENLGGDIELQKVSELVRLSPPAFCRFFKKRTHKTFTAYVNHLRIVKAAQLLIETDKSISEICYQCGFNSISYFNRQFVKYKGNSPKKFRQIYSL